MDDLVELDADAYIRNRLTKAEREHFDGSGYLLVPESLPTAAASELLEAVAASMKVADASSRGTSPRQLALFSAASGDALAAAAVPLLAGAGAFPKVVDILGVNIWAQDAFVRLHGGGRGGEPPVAEEGDWREPCSAGADLDLLEDADGAGTGSPRLWVRCLHFPAAGSVVHLRPRGAGLLSSGGDGRHGPGAAAAALQGLQLQPPAGATLIVDRRLEYAVGAGPVLAVVQYGYRWLRPTGAMAVEPVLARTACPVARQLLGCTTTMAGLYRGTGRDIPLRLWLAEVAGIAADEASWAAEPGLGYELEKDADTFGQGLGSGVGNSIAKGDQLGHAALPRWPAGLALPAGPPAAAGAGLGWAGGAGSDAAAVESAAVDWAAVGLNAAEYQRHRLSAAERAAFDRDGFCVVADALPAEQHEALLEVMTRMRDEAMASGECAAGEAVKQIVFSEAHGLQRCPPLLGLLANPRILPKVVDILGPNLYTYTTNIHATPPGALPSGARPLGPDGRPAATADPHNSRRMAGRAAARGAPAGGAPDAATLPPFGFHQDSGQQADVELRPAPRFSMKAAYYLTDCSEVAVDVAVILAPPCIFH
jgi:hypothetical protein